MKTCDIYIHIYTNKEKENMHQKKGLQKQINQSCLERSFQKTFHQEFPVDKIKKERYGKPCIEDSCHHYNISHSRECLAIAFYDKEIGIDIEEMRKIRMQTILRSCSENECRRLYIDTQQKKGNFIESTDVTRRFLSLWTLKESFVKMTGDGLSYPIAALDFEMEKQEKYLHHLRKVNSNQSEGESFHGILTVCSSEQEKEIFLSVTVAQWEADCVFNFYTI